MSDVPQADQVTRSNDGGLTDSAWGVGSKGTVVPDETTVDVVLMSALKLSEQDAFRRLQLTARERNLRFADVAARIVEQQSLLEPKRNRAATN